MARGVEEHDAGVRVHPLGHVECRGIGKETEATGPRPGFVLAQHGRGGDDGDRCECGRQRSSSGHDAEAPRAQLDPRLEDQRGHDQGQGGSRRVGAPAVHLPCDGDQGARGQEPRERHEVQTAPLGAKQRDREDPAEQKGRGGQRRRPEPRIGPRQVEDLLGIEHPLGELEIGTQELARGEVDATAGGEQGANAVEGQGHAERCSRPASRLLQPFAEGQAAEPVEDQVRGKDGREHQSPLDGRDGHAAPRHGQCPAAAGRQTAGAQEGQTEGDHQDRLLSPGHRGHDLVRRRMQQEEQGHDEGLDPAPLEGPSCHREHGAHGQGVEQEIGQVIAGRIPAPQRVVERVGHRRERAVVEGRASHLPAELYREQLRQLCPRGRARRGHRRNGVDAREPELEHVAVGKEGRHDEQPVGQQDPEGVSRPAGLRVGPCSLCHVRSGPRGENTPPLGAWRAQGCRRRWEDWRSLFSPARRSRRDSAPRHAKSPGRRSGRSRCRGSSPSPADNGRGPPRAAGGGRTRSPRRAVDRTRSR